MNWIETEKRKPEFDTPVLVYCRIYGRFIATYEQIGGTESVWGNWRYNDKLGILPPTHWMPLPDSPSPDAELDDLPF